LCRTEPALQVEATAQAPHGDGAGLGQALLNRSCLGPARQTRLIWSSIPPHDNDATHLSCHHLVRHSTFFSLLSCLHLCGTPFSTEDVRACVSSPYSSDTSPDTDSRSGYCTSTRTFHIMCAPSFSPSSDILFVFPAFVMFFLPNLLPRPQSQPRADRRSSTEVRDESVMLLAFLRACRRGGHGGACHA
jgi:hypothetical protein